MKEYELIKNLFSETKDLFKSDAQIVEINGQKWGITCDEFSLEEDLFTDNEPYILGSNLVVATLSDLYATGCKPCFYEHAIVFPKNKNYKWCQELVKGIKDSLNNAGCILIGGDLGQSKKFRYTGIAFGHQVNNISRIFQPIEQFLYVTGSLGDANEAILNFRPTPVFESRKLPNNALSAIDTSGGFIDSIWILHELNPNFRIDVENLPCKDVKYLFGGAGEYELIFTSKEDNLDAIKIGKIIPNSYGLFLNGKEILIPPPSPRNYNSLFLYILDVLKISKRYK